MIAIFPLIFIFVVLVPFVIWLPLTAFFGGWDDESVEIFERSVTMAKIAKFFTIPMLRGLLWAKKRAKLHNKFGYDKVDQALIEARDLMELKKTSELEKR